MFLWKLTFPWLVHTLLPACSRTLFQHIFFEKYEKQISPRSHTHTHRNLYGIFFAWFDLLVSAPPWTPSRSGDGWFHECSFIKVTLVISGMSHKEQHEPRQGGRPGLHSIIVALKTDYGHTSARHVACVLYFSQTDCVISLKPSAFSSLLSETGNQKGSVGFFASETRGGSSSWHHVSVGEGAEQSVFCTTPHQF